MLYLITIKGIKEQSLLSKLTIQDFQGITFKAPADKEVVVKLNQQIIPTDITLENEHQWVKIPIRKIDWPLD